MNHSRPINQTTPRFLPGLLAWASSNSVVVAALLLFAFFGITSQTFLLPNNIFNIFRQMSVVAVLGIGMTLVILIGGIDLSVGSSLFMTAAISAMLTRDGTNAGIAIAIGLMAAAAVGLLNGLLVEGAGISPVIVTLGTLIGARGVALVLINNAQIRVTDPFFQTLAITRTPSIEALKIPGLPLIVIIVFVLYFVTALLMRSTLYGRMTYAIGGNQTAAQLSGLPVRRVKILTYTLCGLYAGIAGLLIAASTGVISPNLGSGSEFYTIAAVVLGGTSLTGGIGRVEKTLIGAFVLFMTLNWMTIRHVPTEWQQAATGLLLLAAILIDRLARRGRST